MDEAGIAARAVALVAPSVARGAEELAKKVGGEVGERVVKLWDAINARLGGKDALADVEAKPEDERRWSALEVQLEKVLDADPKFREEVARLIEAIPEQDRAAIQQIANVTGDQNVAVQSAGAGSRVTIQR